MTETIITLVCGHTNKFKSAPPRVGEMAWCYRCVKDREVLHAPDEFSIKCHTCRFKKSFGAARVNAEIGAGRHRRIKGKETHIVGIYNGVKLVRVYDGKMPTLDDAVPAEDVSTPSY